MKLKYFFAIFSLIFLTSCEKTIYTLIVETNVFVQEGKTATYNISAGNGGYKITNPNTDIVKAEVKGSKIEYTGIGEGKCTITLKDAENETASIQVHVGIKPVEFTRNYSSDTSSDVLSDFGVSFEENKETQTFTIKAINNAKLRQGGPKEEHVLTSDDLKDFFKNTNFYEELSFKTLPILFGTIYNGNYTFVIIKDIQSTDNNMKKLSGFYFQAR